MTTVRQTSSGVNPAPLFSSVNYEQNGVPCFQWPLEVWGLGHLLVLKRHLNRHGAHFGTVGLFVGETIQGVRCAVWTFRLVAVHL